MKFRTTNVLLGTIAGLLAALTWLSAARPTGPITPSQMPSAAGVPAPLSPLLAPCGNAALEARRPLRDSELTDRGCPRRPEEGEGEELKVFVELGAETVGELMDLGENEYVDWVRYVFACQPKVSDIIRRKASRRQFTLYGSCAWTEDGRVLNDVVWRERRAEDNYYDDPWTNKKAATPPDLQLPTLDFSDWARLSLVKSDKVVVRSRLRSPVPLLRKMAQDGTLCLVDEFHVVDPAKVSEKDRTELCATAAAVRWLAMGPGCVTKLMGVTCSAS
ncbi:hypothetical protein DFJ74DRAFT_708303 [Hyaloraphidium curvatum]|nr:hypothetical protein DFJ74DRAFT_708303 [Hyaloraphidium curvatum]